MLEGHFPLCPLRQKIVKKNKLKKNNINSRNASLFKVLPKRDMFGDKRSNIVWLPKHFAVWKETLIGRTYVW